MRLFLTLLLSSMVVGCGSSKKGDDAETQLPNKEAAADASSTDVKIEGIDLSTPEKAVYEAIMAAQIDDSEEAFEAYLRLMHPDLVRTVSSVEAVRNNVFRRFRKQCDWYVHGESKGDFVRVKRIPAVITPDVQQVEIHVRDLVHGDEKPAVIILRRHGGEWRIVSNSM